MTTPSQPTRRTALGLFASAGAALTAGAAIGGDPSVLDVLIVGGGAAGIGAAMQLPPGVNWRIFEAAPRIGGRALTDTTSFPIPFDIGCAWIHGADNPTNVMAREAKTRGYVTHDCGDLGLTDIYYGCAARAPSRLVEEEHKLSEQINAQTIERGKREDVSADRVIEDWSRPADAAATAMGPMDASVDLRNLSTTEIATIGKYEPNLLVQKGYGALVLDIARGLPADRIKTGVHVTEIDSTQTIIEVKTADAAGRPTGATRARRVIVTVSTGVLAKGAIRFKPALSPAHQAAIHDLPMGMLAKIPLLVPGVRQELDGLIDQNARRPIKPFDNIILQRPEGDSLYFLACPWDADLMVGFVGGDFGWAMTHAGEKAAIDFASARLADLFGCNIAKSVSKGLLTPWGTDPLVLGAYASARPGHFAARAALREPAHDRIAFAGEALAENGWFATCHGAYQSGADAVARLSPLQAKAA